MSNLAIALKQLHRGASAPYPCGAGGGYFSVSAEGRWYACHRAIGAIDYELGDNSGLDRAKRRTFLERRHVDAQADCRVCWARYLCSGGCHQEKAARSEASCDFIRGWLEFCLQAYCDLIDQCPDTSPSATFAPRSCPHEQNAESETDSAQRRSAATRSSAEARRRCRRPGIDPAQIRGRKLLPGLECDLRNLERRFFPFIEVNIDDNRIGVVSVDLTAARAAAQAGSLSNAALALYRRLSQDIAAGRSWRVTRVSGTFGMLGALALDIATLNAPSTGPGRRPPDAWSAIRMLTEGTAVVLDLRGPGSASTLASGCSASSGR